MVIYNVTFLVENRDEGKFLEWLKGQGLAAMAGEGSGVAWTRLTKVLEVPGDPDFASQACSFGLQLAFANLEDAKRWENTSLAKAMQDYITLFGAERALTFSTILEEIAL